MIVIQSPEQEVALGACSSISGTVRNTETSTNVLSLILNYKSRKNVGTRMYQMVNFKCMVNFNAITNS